MRRRDTHAWHVRALPANSLRMAQRDCATGLYLQMYYWGKDVLNPGGNLLQRYGFRRIPKQTPHGSSRYRLPWGDGVIELHGFVAGWYRPHGQGLLFVRHRRVCQRYDGSEPVAPEALEEALAYTPRALPECREFSAVLGEFLRFLLDYEAFVLRECGVAYRQEVFEEYRALRLSHWWLRPAEALAWYRRLMERPHATPRARIWERRCSNTKC